MERGKESMTEFLVKEHFQAYSLVELIPLTGRRHQLRVHLYSIGHPIVGDLRYGDKLLQRNYRRLMLHAERIRFRLPSGKETTVEAPISDSFMSVIENIRQDHAVIAENDHLKNTKAQRISKHFLDSSHLCDYLIPWHPSFCTLHFVP